MSADHQDAAARDESVVQNSSLSVRDQAAVANRDAMSSMDRGDLKAAEIGFRQAVTLDPRNPDYCCNLGEVLRRQGNSQQASEMFDMALTIDPKHFETQVAVGMLCIDLEQYELALDFLRCAAQIHPEARPQLTETIGKVEELIRAEAECMDAAEGSATDLPSGETEDAQPVSDGTRDEEQDAAAPTGDGPQEGGVPSSRDGAAEVHQSAVSALAGGRLEEAESAFRAAIGLDPGNVEHIANLAETLRRKGDYRGAADLLNLVLTLDAKNIGGQIGAGALCIDLGQHRLALDFFRSAVQVHPEVRDRVADTIELLEKIIVAMDCAEEPVERRAAG